MLRGRRIDLHAADRIDRGAAVDRVLAAAAGMRCAMRGMLVILVRHLTSSLRAATLDLYTLGGYIDGMRTDIKASCLKRLKRIEGQVRGLPRMVDEDRYCIDIVTQIAAARTALRRVEEEILRDHVAHCVDHAIASGDREDQRRKIAELMEVVSRADR